MPGTQIKPGHPSTVEATSSGDSITNSTG